MNIGSKLRYLIEEANITHGSLQMHYISLPLL